MVDDNAAWMLLHSAESFDPASPAYLFGESVLTYGGLAGNARRFASLFASRGLNPGDRVVLALPDTPAFPAAFLGAMLAGVCPVPVNTFLKPQDYAFLVMDSGARLLLTSDGHQSADAATPHCPALCCGDFGPPDLDACPADFTPRSPADGLPGFMLYSSGSTGRPKGVPHFQEDLLVPPRTWGRVLGLARTDVVLSSSRMFFAYGLLTSLVLPLSAGASVALFSGKPGPYDMFDLMQKHRPTAFFGVPTLYNLMLRAFEPGMKDSVPSLCYSAGEALPPLIQEEWARLTGVDILDGIGSTEAFNVFISNRKADPRPGSSGRIVPGYEARLVDDAGETVPQGSKGHLIIRGEGLCRGYWGRPDKTRETMLPDGWVRTGDVYVEQDGWYEHQGRSDDMIKSGGQWVSPVQVEEALLRHPAVAECAVAVRRVDGLDLICAFVVPAADSGPENGLKTAWRKFLLDRLPGHMCPARFECVPELPKTATGKVQRFMLRE